MEFLEVAFQQLLGSNATSALNLANPKWDVMVFAFLFMTTLFYGLGLSKNKILAFLFSTYIALAIVDSLPVVSSWWGNLKEGSELGIGLVLLSVVIFIIAFLFAHSALSKFFAKEEARSPVAYNFLLSFLHVGLITHIVLSSIPNDVAMTFSLFTQRLFMGDVARVFWFLFPLVTIIILAKKIIPQPRRRKPVPPRIQEEVEEVQEDEE